LLENNNRILIDYNISYESYIVLRLRGGAPTEYHLPNNLFDDTGKKIEEDYDRYGDCKWLGCQGNSNNNTKWTVSYHGTKISCTEPIAKEGLKPGTRNAYGVGIYCIPNIARTIYTNLWKLIKNIK